MSAKKRKKKNSYGNSPKAAAPKIVQKRTILQRILEPVDSDGFFMRNLWFFVAFLIPAALMYIFFCFPDLFMSKAALEGVDIKNLRVEPYGNQQILVTDLWHQYYPFLVDFHDKLREGGSLLWTWKSGGGINYLALMSYYLASPLNFLSILVPPEHLREFLTIITCAKVGFASLFFAQFIRITFKRRDVSVAGFGIMYALCAFVMGYYWNVIWLDTFALLPLVVAGAIAVLKDGKFRLYVISLALAVLTNYYIGLFVCIFIVLVSIVYCIVEYTNIKDLITKFFKMVGYSALGLGITAILTLPAYFALTATQSSAESGTTYSNTCPEEFAIYLGDSPNFKGVMQAFAKILSNSINFVSPNEKNGTLPNIYCGIAILILAVLFFTCKNIKIRERIAGGALCLLFFLSFTIKQLDFVWHGFHFPNMLPYRYSFLFSFVLIVMAYRVFMNIDCIKIQHVLLTAAIMFAIYGIVVDNFGTDITDERLKKIAIYGTIVISAILLIWLLMYTLEVVPRNALAVVLVLICVAEGTCSAFFGIKKVGTNPTTSYPLGTTDTLALVDEIDELEQNSTELVRTEVTKYHTLNDNALIGVNGISMFSSMVNSDVTAYMEKFGLSGWVASNRYTYQESSPVTNMFLNIKYLISPYGKHLDKQHTSLIAKSGNVALLRNEYHMPLGFMVDEALLTYDVEKADSNPFINQNQIFRLATGIQEDVYTPMTVKDQGHSDSSTLSYSRLQDGFYSYNLVDTSQDSHFKFNYYPEHDGTAYAYLSSYNCDSVDLRVNDSTVVTNYIKCPYIMQVGSVKANDKVSVYVNLPKDKTSGSVYVYCYMLNDAVFEQGYNDLRDGALNATKTTETLIEGTVNAKESGLFYTSISYDKGWKAYVDSEEVEITPVANAQIAFKVPAGTHQIKLKYVPQGFVVGTIVTFASILVFAFMIILTTRKEWLNKLLKKPVAVSESSETNEETNE